MRQPSDGYPDDRVICRECAHCDAGSFRCRAYKTSVLVEQPLRCPKFRPLPSNNDQRTGSERWPNLQKIIEEVRALDLASRVTLKRA